MVCIRFGGPSLRGYCGGGVNATKNIGWHGSYLLVGELRRSSARPTDPRYHQRNGQRFVGGGDTERRGYDYTPTDRHEACGHDQRVRLLYGYGARSGDLLGDGESGGVQ